MNNYDTNKIDFDKIKSIGDLIGLCLECNTKEEAKNLMEQYEKWCDSPEIAHKNLGYILGYCSGEDRTKLYSLFEVNHPIFGSNFGRDKMTEELTNKTLEERILDMPKQIKTQTLFTADLAAEVETLRLKVSETKNAEMQKVADNPANKNADMRKAALESALKENRDYLKDVSELKIKEQTLNVNRTHLEYLHLLNSAYKAVAGIRVVR